MRNYDQYVLEDLADDLADKIVRRYDSYGVNITIKAKGITILNDRFQYEIKIPKGTRVDQIEKYAKDVQFALKLPLFRVMQKDLSIYIIASMVKSTNFTLRRLMESPEYQGAVDVMGLAHPIGFDQANNPFIKDLTLYPHAIFAGTTGSGKTRALIALLVSLLMKYSPEEVNLLICDLAGDLLQFDEFPHLSYPIIQDFDTFLYVILEVREKMEQRIKMKGTKRFSRLPRLVIASDEFTSFISGTDAKSKLAREAIAEILRRGRHAKIHFIAAAHNPTQQRLGLDIADIPTKLAFRVARLSNSLAILSAGGAEKLLGNGDMLFQSSQCNEPQRIQGADIGPKTLEYLLTYIRQKLSGKTFNLRHKFVIEETDRQSEALDVIADMIRGTAPTKQDVENRLFAKIAVWALGHDSISCNMITEAYNIGWRRANKFIKSLHDMGIVGDLDANLPRKILTVTYEDLSPHAVDFLNRHGQTEEMIKQALDVRKRGEQA